MTLLDLIIVLIYFLLAALAKLDVSALTLCLLVAVLIVARLLVGERITIGRAP